MMTDVKHVRPDTLHHKGADALKENKKVYKTRDKIRYYNKMATKKEDYKTATPDELYDILNEAKTPTIYESIEDGIKPYVDFEKDFKTKRELEANKATIRAFIIKDLARVLKCDEEKIAVMEAHGKKNRMWRASFHLVAYDAPPMSDGLEMLRILKADNNKAGFDLSVYKPYGRRQLFRTVLSEKEVEGPRKFVRTDKPLTKDNFNECLVSVIGDYEIKETTEERKGAMSRAEQLEEMEQERHWREHEETQEARIQDYKRRIERGENGGVYCTRAELEEIQVSNPDRFNFIDKYIKKASNALERYKPNIFKNTNGLKAFYLFNNDMGYFIFKRGAPGYCKDHKRTHEADNCDAVYMAKNGKCFYTCTKTPHAQFYPLFKVPKEERQKELIDTLTAKNKKIYNEAIEAFINIYDFENVKQSRAKWCADVKGLVNAMTAEKKNRRQLIALRSNLGTGKSVALLKAIEKYTTENPEGKVLILTQRIILSKQNARQLKKLGFFCYLDREAGQHITNKRAIVQLDSLNHLNWNIKNDPVGLVIIDEADQALRHLNADTFKNNPNANDNLKKLYTVLRNTKKLIVMSGNLTADNVQDWEAIAGHNLEPTIFINDSRAYHTPLKILMAQTDEQILRDIVKSLDEGLKVYLSSNKDIEKIKTMFEYLIKGRNIKALLITKETMSEPEVKEAVEGNINDVWQKYQFIAVSPCVQSAVSFDIEGHFDKIYGLFTNGSNSSGDACQMLRRIRHPKIKEIFVNVEQHSGIRPTHYEDILAGIYNDQTDILKGMKRYLEGHLLDPRTLQARIDERHPYPRLVAKLTAQENADRNNYLENFIKNQIIYGNTVENVSDANAKENKEIIKEEVKHIGEELKDQKAEELAQADELTEDQAQKLLNKQKKEPLTKEEQTKLEKYFILYCYGFIETPPPEAKFYRKYGDKKIRRLYKTIKGFYGAAFSFDEGLEHIRSEDHYKIRNKLIRNKEGTVEDKHSDIIIKTTGIKAEYAKHKLAINIFKKLGFTSFHDDSTIKADEMLNNLKTIHTAHLMNSQELVVVLKKERRKAAAIAELRQDSKTFIRHMLKFINGLFNDLYDIRIIATDSNRKEYKLVGPIDDLFLRVYNNEFIPTLGNIEKPKQEHLYDLYEQFEQQNRK